MDNYPSISVIIPLYNTADYIVDCLNSVVNQTFSGAIECIIIDDCGTDDSVEVVDEFLSKYEGKVRFKFLHHSENRGLSAARNTGLIEATGDYFYFLDSDDTITPTALDNLFRAINTDSGYAIAISYCTSVVNGESHTYKEEWLFDSPRIIESQDFAYRMLTEQSNFAAWAKLYRRDLFGNARFPVGKYNEDTLFVLEIKHVIEKFGLKCIDIPDYSYRYLMREGSICHNAKCPVVFYAMQNYDKVLEECSNDNRIVSWIRQRQTEIAVALMRNKNLTKPNYMKVHHYFSRAVLAELVRGKRMKTIVHLLMFRYLPRLTYAIEHI